MKSKIISRLTSMIVKGLVKAIDDSTQVQLVKVATRPNEIIDGMERIQNYGLSSNPPENGEAVVVFVNSNSENGVVIACDSASDRPTGNDVGDVLLYSTHGQSIKLGSDSNTVATQSGTFNIGSGSDFVAMSAKTDALFTAVQTACATFVPPGTPDGGAALATAIASALSSIVTASTNLKAD